MKRTKIAGRVPSECCNGSMMGQDPERWKFRLIKFICGKVPPFCSIHSTSGLCFVSMCADSGVA